MWLCFLLEMNSVPWPMTKWQTGGGLRSVNQRSAKSQCGPPCFFQNETQRTEKYAQVICHLLLCTKVRAQLFATLDVMQDVQKYTLPNHFMNHVSLFSWVFIVWINKISGTFLLRSSLLSTTVIFSSFMFLFTVPAVDLTLKTSHYTTIQFDPVHN